MKTPILIKNANIVNEGKNYVADVLIEYGIISRIGNLPMVSNYKIIDATGKQVGAYDLQTKTVLDLSPFAKGIYLIRIVTNAETLEQKIVLR